MAMTRLQLDSPNRNVDPTTLSTNLFYIQDGYRDQGKAIHRRPGLDEVIDLGVDAPIDGKYWWDKNGVGIAVCGGRIFSYSQTYVVTELTSGSAVLAARGQCRFAEVKKTSNNTVYLAIANGERIVITDGISITVLNGVDDPVNCTHICHIDGYLIANDISTEERKNQWLTTPVNDPTTFTGGQSYTAPMQVDDIIALVESNRQLYVVGTQTIEPWYDSGAAIAFSRVNGGLKNVGTYSKDSVVSFKDDIYFMTDKRQIAKMSGYDIEYISSGKYDKYIQELETIDDVRMEVVSAFGGRDWLLIHFPSEGKTLAYEINIKEWNEWGYYSNNQYSQFLGINHIYSIAWGVHLIGDNTTGKIYTFSEDNLTDNGTTIRLEIVTGHYDHGTSSRKRSRKLRIKFKRGETVTSKVVYIYWRDDGNSEWGNAVEATLDSGSLGDRELFVELQPMGIYVSRQYKIVFGDQADIVLSYIEEDVKVIE